MTNDKTNPVVVALTEAHVKAQANAQAYINAHDAATAHADRMFDNKQDAQTIRIALDESPGNTHAKHVAYELHNTLRNAYADAINTANRTREAMINAVSDACVAANALAVGKAQSNFMSDIKA